MSEKNIAPKVNLRDPNLPKGHITQRFFFVSNAGILLIFLGMAVAIKLTTFTNNPDAYYRNIETLKMLFDEPLNYNPYESLFAKISQLIWCFPLATCLFTYSIVKSKSRNSRMQGYFFFAALLLFAILLEDVFRLGLYLNHWLDAPRYLPRIFYLFAAVALGTHYRREILKTPFWILLIALLCLAISITADLIPVKGVGLPIMAEDGCQLLGTLNLAIYFWESCRIHLFMRLN